MIKDAREKLLNLSIKSAINFLFPPRKLRPAGAFLAKALFNGDFQLFIPYTNYLFDGFC